MTETRKLRVFLCHSSQDKPIVRELYQRLKAEGWIDPWLDEEKLLPGQDWDLEIEKAVRTTDAVIVCLSTNSVDMEGYVQHEIRLVLRTAGYKPEDTIFLIPIRLNDCAVPMRLELQHYVDFFPVERKEWAYSRLFKALKIRLGQVAKRETKERAQIKDEEHSHVGGRKQKVNWKDVDNKEPANNFSYKPPINTVAHKSKEQISSPPQDKSVPYKETSSEYRNSLTLSDFITSFFIGFPVALAIYFLASDNGVFIFALGGPVIVSFLAEFFLINKRSKLPIGNGISFISGIASATPSFLSYLFLAFTGGGEAGIILLFALYTGVVSVISALCVGFLYNKKINIKA